MKLKAELGERNDLFGVVETLEVVLAKERTVLGLAAARHALAEVDPEIVATAFVPCDSPAGCHCCVSRESVVSTMIN